MLLQKCFASCIDEYKKEGMSVNNIYDFLMLSDEEKQNYELYKCERIREYLHDRKNIELKIFTLTDGDFFALFLQNPFLPFTSYELLKEELIVCKDKNELKLGGKKQRFQLSTIEAVRKKFNICINSAIEILSQYGLGVSIPDHYIELLEDQLIFDILFDKYLKKEKMTAIDYARYICGINGDSSIPKVESIRKSIERAMNESCAAVRKHHKLEEQVKAISFSLNFYEKYFTGKVKENISKEKSRAVWSVFYYNRNMLTYRQYRRELTKKNRNYSYERFICDLQEYDDFVKKLLPKENEDAKKYFNRIMDYYVLESYKRIDFDFKLVKTLSKIGISEIDKKHWWVKRFHPCTLMPYEKNNELLYTANVKATPHNCKHNGSMI